MQNIIKRIEELNNLYPYPHRIKMYRPPANKIDIEKCEEKLAIKIDPQLKEIYEFSNGLSFNDYCLYGFKNRKIADFTSINYDFMDEMPKLENRFISFMRTSDSIQFGFFSDEPNRVFLLRDPYSSDFQIIADSIKDFFNIFLDKISTMFENMKPNEVLSSIPEWGLEPHLAQASNSVHDIVV